MSNPSIVEGIYFSMYPNVILEAINQSNMTKTQIKICNHIIRQTFGWHIMHKMIQYDGRDPELIRYAIISTAQDSYWMEHILRPEEFRASFDAIINDDLF